ncbi:MAG: pyruvate dehydrogenase (acetyl-transferring) E1 component subunit alpha [Desulfobacterales bacterium]|nr:pyruvate dehydrogenase (acetyl-transferring) E1 component subunit alpha [Desulfobacterales bacterium]
MPLDIIETFQISHLSILDENGKVDKDLEPRISDEKLIRLHRAMTLSRMVDARLLNLQRQGRLGTLPVCTGQEAAFCAAALAIRERDWFVGSYRELGARLMRGETLDNILLLFNGHEEGNVNPVNDRTLPVSIVLGSQLPHAVGLAYGSRLRGEEDTVALTVFGDGSTSEGDFHEGLNFAGVLNAPVIFLCQNNQFAISTPRAWQTRSETIAQKAVGYGIPGIQVDGNDALAVYSAVKEAADRARAGEGPSLIEAVTFRMGVHTTADDPTRYRGDDMVEDWAAKDPLIRFKSYITEKGIWDEEKQAELEAGIKTDIDTAVTEFEKGRDIKPDAPFDYVFGTKAQIIEDQRARFLADLEKEADHG